MKRISAVLSVVLLGVLVASAADPYRKPPQAVLDVLNAPSTPILMVSPTGNEALSGQLVRYPPISELSQRMLRLAGLRINPQTNGLHNAQFDSKLVLWKLGGGAQTAVELPPGAKLNAERWSPDGSHFAFANTTASGIELWVGDSGTGKAHRVEGVRLNAVMGGRGDSPIGSRTPTPGGGRGGRGGAGGGTVQWMPDGKSLLVTVVKANRGAEPAESRVPAGPHVQESLGGGAPVVTHEDMLQNPHDEDVFAYYATAQLATVDLASGKETPVGKPGIVTAARVSPNGKYLLVTTVHKPFSYLYPASEFPKDIEVWDMAGRVVKKLASLPLEDRVPINGVPTGPRYVEWRPSEPATLLWVEALDEGDLRKQAAFRDQIVSLKAPFNGEPVEVFKTEQRFTGMRMAAKGGMALVEDSNRRTRHVRTFLIDLDKPGAEGKLIWDRNNQDRYHDPGVAMEKTMPNGGAAVLLDGDNIFLEGAGSSPGGDHPFLTRFNLATHQTEKLFQSDDDHYETVVALLDAHAARFLTRRESPTEPPNYLVHTTDGKTSAVTHFPDPQPSIRNIHKELVKYKRPDGVELSFTLYLPADHKAGTRLPTVIWAYPYEYSDADTAGQVSGSTQRFTEMTGYSELFFALEGYAVLANTAMPVVGADPDSVNNTYIDQIVADAKAAIDKASEMGVTDPARVGVGGHSYGAFMTDNLLAHCDLFKAGIAESGAPNRTLTPFGFQSERRTIWQAPDVYLKMSPFLYADKIKTPLLLIHGEADDNDGTFPIQSERMYEAVRGNGGTVRLVFLPYEAHGYRAKETIEHVLWEKFAWFDKYVKGTASTTTSK
ncbi:MAG TPA: prolyl oligopeptidase family serine peptidase [Bryobacteraceae bacterium]|nr:prolyl oligopeptidase family serine peptidase [Bryobacteraceae bacterium]